MVTVTVIFIRLSFLMMDSLLVSQHVLYLGVVQARLVQL